MFVDPNKVPDRPWVTLLLMAYAAVMIVTFLTAAVEATR